VDTKKLASKISLFSSSFREDHLAERIKVRNIYLTSPEKAFEFITGVSFYQGRRDTISKKFEDKTKAMILPLIRTDNIFLSSSNIITDKTRLENEYNQIYSLLKNGGINKKGDRLMVISIINFIQSIEHHNILLYLVDLIKSRRIAEAYQQLDGIWSIGSKIASLILRDIVYIYELENVLETRDYYYLQPVDTWVHQISRQIGIVEKEEIYNDESLDIVDRCNEFGVNPIHYNQGAWYLGTNSLKIVLRNIDSIVS